MYKCYLRNQGMQISPTVTPDEMGCLLQPAAGWKRIFRSYQQTLTSTSPKANVLGHHCSRGKPGFYSISLSNSLHKYILMAKFKLKIFRPERFSVQVVWDKASKSIWNHYQQTMMMIYYSSFLNTLLLMIKIKRKIIHHHPFSYRIRFRELL